MQIFVTGTDTNVGKTVVTAGIAAVMQSLGYQAGVYKPFQSGAIERNGFYVSPDLAYVKKVDFYVETMCSYILKEPAAPFIAAELEKINIDLENITKDFNLIKRKCETVLVEGAGGLLVPVTQRETMADVIKMLNIPTVIVARPDLGTVNHTLMTINQAELMGIKIAGVIINKYPEDKDDVAIKTAPRLIEDYSNAKILGIIPAIKNFEYIKPSDLIDIMINCVDIEKVFGLRIPKLNLEY